jgi:crotonobetainyl-CoA:carnitine CoA-transferase CaiB-like acyl-CoA transferase
VGVWLAGPGAGAILGDLGAQVIKVESLDGDPVRAAAGFGPTAKAEFPPDWSLIYEIANRNKRAIAVDITVPGGQSILHDLVRDADVFITNLRPSTKKRLGIDYQSLSAVNPRLVHVSVSGFGANGSYRDLGAYDPMGQAISGMMFLANEDHPTLLQVVILDQLTSITASHAAMTALYARDRQGVGQEVHASLYGSATWLMYGNILASSLFQSQFEPSWLRTKNGPLRNTYRCADDEWITVTSHPEQPFWKPFCQAIGLPDLGSDDRFDSTEKRSESLPLLLSIIDEQLAGRPRAQISESLIANGVSVVPINRTEDILVDPQARANGYIVDFDLAPFGSVAIPGFPIQFMGQEAGMRSRAPGLGEHTDEILSEIGLLDSEIQSLRETGIVK